MKMGVACVGRPSIELNCEGVGKLENVNWKGRRQWSASEVPIIN